MKLINTKLNATINTNKEGTILNCTVLEFDGETKRYSYSSAVKNIFAIKRRCTGPEVTFQIFRLTGNGKFSVAEIFPYEIIKYISDNE